MEPLRNIILSVDSFMRWSLSPLYPRHVSNEAIANFNRRNHASDIWGLHRGASCIGIVRLAGLSGAAAVALAAYGAHVVAERKDINDSRKRSLENGNKQHFIHTIGLLLAHKARCPLLTAALFSAGIICFCGPCYAYAIWDDECWKQVTPAGGVLFILGWMSFIL